MNKISVVIPTLNEERSIGALLQHLMTSSRAEQIADIIIVDGGSTDGTLGLVESFKQVRVLKASKGRAIQLNAGAKVASGNILYFLHADSFPPKHFDDLIIEQVERGHRAGCFRLKFDSDHWWLRLAGWFTQFNWKICRGGDQSLFTTKALFNEIGGYDENYHIYEDNIMIGALFDRKEHVVIKAPILTSSRLYASIGIWKLQFHFWRIHLMHRRGASAADLLAYYRSHIAR